MCADVDSLLLLSAGERSQGHLDNDDTSQIDRIGRTLPGETADPGSSGFPNIALDEGTGVNEIHRHVNVARE